MLSSFSNAEAFLRRHRRLVPPAGAVSGLLCALVSARAGPRLGPARLLFVLGRLLCMRRARPVPEARAVFFPPALMAWGLLLLGVVQLLRRRARLLLAVCRCIGCGSGWFWVRPAIRRSATC